MTRLGSGSNAGPRHRIFTWSEVGKSADAYQNTLSSSQVCKIAASGIHPAYIVIDNKVYDLAIHGDHFFRWHPGAFVPLACVGRDATSAVEAFHGRNSDASSFMETYYVGDLELPVTKTAFEQDLDALREHFFNAGKYQSCKYYYASKYGAAFLCEAVSVLLLYHWGVSSWPAIVIAALMRANFIHQVGILAHEIEHNQVFHGGFPKHCMSYIGILLIGVSHGFWNHSHGMHHAHVETSNMIQGNEFMKKSKQFDSNSSSVESSLSTGPSAKKLPILLGLINMEPLFMFPLMIIGHTLKSVKSVLFALKWTWYIQPVEAVVCLFLLFGYWATTLVVPYMLCSPLKGLVFLILSKGVSGLSLALITIVNHNCMYPHNYKDKASDMSWAQHQIVFSRNITYGPLKHYMMAGMDLQIEHHLFPRMPRHSLLEIRPLLKSLCKKHGVSYRETSFIAGIREILDYFYSAKAAGKVFRLMNQN